MTTNKEKCDAVGLAFSIGPENGGIRLTQWEEEFMESVEERIDEGGKLTEKQQAILDKLYDKT